MTQATHTTWASSSTSSGWTGLLAVVLSATALGIAVWLYLRYPGFLVSGVANTDPKGHVDFETFWRSTVALLHGADVYHTGSVLPNLNPPLLSLLLAPFGLIPALPSYWAFTGLTVLLVTWSVLVTARELRLGRGATLFGVLSLWVCSPLQGTLLLGQIYGMLLAGLTLAWLAQRRGREPLASVILGVVVALKPSLAPLLFIPLAASPRRWPAFGAGVTSAAVSSLLGVLAAGPASALEWLRLATGTPAPEVDANASLPGLVARLGGPGVLGWLVTLVVVLVSVCWTRRATPSPSGVPKGTVEQADATIFAVAAGCLLAAPIAWLNYEVMLWPGVLVLLRAGRWRVAVPLLVFPAIPVAWGNLWQAAPTAPAALLGRSLYCAILLAFWIALLAFLPGWRARATDGADWTEEAVADGHAQVAAALPGGLPESPRTDAESVASSETDSVSPGGADPGRSDSGRTPS